jgi:uncharacterized Zn-binding protein involved in type VI secretion
MGGFPAARLTDPTAHGGLVVVGCPTVMMDFLPAARIGDMHVCPMVTVLVPHVGGPFVLGSFTVMVGGVPQSRVTDMLICVGPPDVLVNGSPTVMVGMVGSAGMVSLMMGGMFAGLKNFLAGYPKATLDANGNVETQYNSQITIQGSPAYQAYTIADLNTFLATPTGKRWLAAYEKTGKHITIKPIPPGTQQNNGFTHAESKGAYAKKDGTHGDGSDSTILYNPSDTSEYKAADGTTQTMPPDQTLGHEMIHGLHNGQGNNLAGNKQPSPYGNEEESQTIGVNGHDDDDITERTMQDDAGQSNRPDHDSITRDVYQDSGGQWHDTNTDSSGNETDKLISAPPNGRPNH